MTEDKNNKGIKYYYKKLMKFLEHPFYAAVAASLFVSVIANIFNYTFSIKPLNEKVDNVNNNMQNTVNQSVTNATKEITNKISGIETNIQNMETNIQGIQNEVNSYDTEINNISEDFESFKNEVKSQISNNITITIDQHSPLANSIKETYSSDQAVYLSSGKYAVMDLKQIAGSDIYTGKSYTAEELNNKTINFKYDNENGEDVFFKGQYDENGYWYGNCIINRYKDEKLTMIMDAVYDSGKLISYKQVFPYTTSFGNDVWVVSNREVLENDVRSGETFMYFRKSDYIKSFDNESASNINIINTEEFLLSIDRQIEGYYNGYTSEGKFNDDSKDAYLVKYKEDGDVRYLYVGAIKDGVANDDSGQAWSLSWGYANDGYHYHKGKFSNGDPIGTTGDWLKPVTQEQIDAIVNPDAFNCSLQGLINETV